MQLMFLDVATTQPLQQVTSLSLATYPPLSRLSREEVLQVILLVKHALSSLRRMQGPLRTLPRVCACVNFLPKPTNDIPFASSRLDRSKPDERHVSPRRTRGSRLWSQHSGCSAYKYLSGSTFLPCVDVQLFDPLSSSRLLTSAPNKSKVY